MCRNVEVLLACWTSSLVHGQSLLVAHVIFGSYPRKIINTESVFLVTHWPQKRCFFFLVTLAICYPGHICGGSEQFTLGGLKLGVDGYLRRSGSSSEVATMAGFRIWAAWQNVAIQRW